MKKQSAMPKYQNPESEAMLVSSFKREFARKLTDLLGLSHARPHVHLQKTNGGGSYAKLHANYISTPLSNALSQETGREMEYANPRRHILPFEQVDEMTHRMGFLQSIHTRPQAEDDELTDLYTIFKCNKEQKILAENLQTVLMAVAGITDPSIAVDNDISNNKWMLSGVYE